MSSYARAVTAQENQKKSLSQLNEAKQFLGGQLTSVFSGIITGSMSAADAVKRLADAFVEAAIQAAFLGQGPLAGLFGGGGGILGSIFGFSGGGMASASLFADGGHVCGPGTGTSDSIPAMISNGEFIINAAQTKKYLPL